MQSTYTYIAEKILGNKCRVKCLTSVGSAKQKNYNKYKNRKRIILAINNMMYLVRKNTRKTFRRITNICGLGYSNTCENKQFQKKCN